MVDVPSIIFKSCDSCTSLLSPQSTGISLHEVSTQKITEYIMFEASAALYFKCEKDITIHEFFSDEEFNHLFSITAVRW